VVSCNEEFERVVTLSQEEWKNIGVDLFKVNVADFDFAPSIEQLDEAAEFMNKYISENQGVYVHCKAGRTRSSTVLAAYLIKYRKETPESAFSLIQSKRTHAILHEVHQEALKNFYNHVNKN